MTFEIYQDSDRQWCWQLKNVLGEIVAVSNGGYAERYRCEQAIFFVQGSSRGEVVELDAKVNDPLLAIAQK